MDAVIAYDCPHSGETYLLVVRNALCIPSMDHNLVPPFVLREAGLILNDKPKIHYEDPSVEDHSLLHEETGLRIPFTLSDTFSVFETRSLTDEEIENAENYPTVFLTPDSNKWDPYDESYKLNDDLFLGSRGDMFLPSTASKRTLATEAGMLAAGPENDNNDMADAHVATIEAITHFPISTHLDIPQPQEWGQIREVSEIDVILST